MSKPRTSADPNQKKRHKFYGDVDLVAALDKLCELEDRSRSEIVVRLVRNYVRSKAAKLRKARYALPQAVISK